MFFCGGFSVRSLNWVPSWRCVQVSAGPSRGRSTSARDPGSSARSQAERLQFSSSEESLCLIRFPSLPCSCFQSFASFCRGKLSASQRDRCVCSCRGGSRTGVQYHVHLPCLVYVVVFFSFWEKAGCLSDILLQQGTIAIVRA